MKEPNEALRSPLIAESVDNTEELISQTTGSRKRCEQTSDDFKENATEKKKYRSASQKTIFYTNTENEMKRQNHLSNLNNNVVSPCKRRRISKETENDSFEVAGRVVSVELENFMCHSHLKVDFDVHNNNCFYIGGPNGSGKSALFAGLNIGLGGRGNMNERGNGLKDYIKEGKKRSKIRIVLTNEGNGRHPNYGPEIAIERIIGNSGSSYALKSIYSKESTCQEKIISTKKVDLDRLLTRFDIQLTNPIFWMSQDRCRAFLQDMKPDKLYKVFMFATELDYTKDCYAKIENYIQDIRSAMDVLRGVLKQKKSEILALNAQKEKMKNIEEKKTKLNELGWILLWLSVRDALKEVRRKEATFDKTKEVIIGIQKRVADFEVAVEEINRKEEACVSEIETLSSEAASVREKVEKRSNEVEGAKQKVLEKTHLLKKKEREVKEVNAQINSVEQVIRQTKARAQKSKNGQIDVGKLEEDLKECCEKEKLLNTERDEVEDEFQKYKAMYDEAVGWERSKIFELRAAENNLKKVCAEKERFEAMSKSEVARFGIEVPSILRIIEANTDRFQKKPIGPLGRFVKVREKRWTLAVELALSNVLRCFLCDSVSDKRVLEVLLRQNGIRRMPSLIIYKYKNERYSTASNEPSEEWLTVMRIVDILDTNVFNALIDQTQMESVLLIETDDKAKKIMNSNPPKNVVKGFTLTGSEVFPNLPGETYRFYPNVTDLKTDLLSGSHPHDTEALCEKIKDMENRLCEVEKECTNAKVQVNEMRKKVNEFSDRLKAASCEVERTIVMRRSLEKKIDLYRVDEDFDNQITNLVASKEEFSEKRKILTAAMAELNTEVDCCKKESLEALTEKRSVELELRSIENRLAKTKQKSLGFHKEVEKLQYEKESALKDIAKLKEKEGVDKEELGAARRSYERLLGETKSCAQLLRPEHSSEPPDFDTLPDTESTRQEYNNLEQYINAAKKCLGSASVTMENLKKLMSDFQIGRRSYKQLENLLKSLEECLGLRQEKYVIIKHATALRLSSAYSRLMRMRNFRGQLVIDHEQRVIEVVAETHQKKAMVESEVGTKSQSQHIKEMQSDLKGLSGGERTYTLACFIMALWEVMESPFRCMDEFDVFLDLNNRKLVMELLVELATHQYPHNQFIFFTPQGITELLRRDRVQLFQLPRVRQD